MEILSLETCVKMGSAISRRSYVTLTMKLALAAFPASSVAVQFTIVPPIGKNVPDDGLHDNVTTPTSSVADGVANDIIFPVEFVV